VLSAEDQRTLFALARAAIGRHLEGAPPPPLPSGPPALEEVRGCFVTLHRGGALRGCIGHPHARLPLAEAVRELAVSAATEDSRFDPVREDELAALELELSVLTPLAPIDPKDVVIGTHGLVVRARGRSGLLLPQVATERGWDAETFLAATCRKAGLPPDEWRRPDAHVLAFSADVYEEHRPG
jgi:AmmeMemoRadiSam system protein A